MVNLKNKYIIVIIALLIVIPLFSAKIFYDKGKEDMQKQVDFYQNRLILYEDNYNNQVSLFLDRTYQACENYFNLSYTEWNITDLFWEKCSGIVRSALK